MVCDTLATFIISAYMGAAGDCAALYQGQVETSISHATWTTHPYWNSNSFQQGETSAMMVMSIPLYLCATISWTTNLLLLRPTANSL